MNANERTTILRTDMMRRMSDGWGLEGEREPFAMTMIHAFPSRWWEVVLAVILGGVWAIPPGYRTMRVRVDEEGLIHRTSTGEVPRGLRRSTWPWDMPDTP